MSELKKPALSSKLATTNVNKNKNTRLPHAPEVGQLIDGKYSNLEIRYFSQHHKSLTYLNIVI